MIKLVAFDLDGTIGDTIPVCIKAFKMAVESYTEHELSEEDIIQTFGLNEEGMIKQIIANDYRTVALHDFYAIYKDIHRLCPHPFPDIKELIGELKDNSILVALITGKGTRSCDITLQQFGMEDFFDKIETGSPEKNRKAEAIKELLACYKLAPNEMVYVGDALSDITECDKAGIKCLSAAWGVSSTTAKLLNERNRESVFYSIESLRDFLFMHESPKEVNKQVSKLGRES